MQLIRGLHNVHPQQRGCVATIGNFDGVHRGHQAVLRQLWEQAARLQLPVTVITFEPQPLEYFAPQQAPARLTRLREKFEWLRRFNVDRIVCLAFNRRLAQMSAQDFIQRVLIDGLGVRYLVIGDDFRFGRGREGDFNLLQQAGRRAGFEVVDIHSFMLEGARVSSTRVRQALQQGDLTLAQRLLGRHYSMSGRVVHGAKLGRQLGFPTANIQVRRYQTPLQGIFVVEVSGLGGQPLPGAASLGTRPTVNGKQILLEVYLLDFDRDIYGAHLQVSFLHKLRDEIHFSTLDALTAQIAADVRCTKAYFLQRQNVISHLEQKLN
ncbi:MAG: bifunctional riboflavin kinase/FAD synthetase [Gammaproteobacteria bacterium]|nr:bifunctional riboflavin kinase/FAD synthetase [Gammaproteobacteria bacterium]